VSAAARFRPNLRQLRSLLTHERDQFLARQFLRIRHR
jgi:hypothetical protein